MRIVSVGECMVEMAPAGTPGQFGIGFAGDTLNTAWYLRQLQPEWQVDYLTAVGQDTMSEAMLAFVGGAGIGTNYIRRLSDRTVGLYLISLVQGERSFSYWRGQAAARLLAEDAGHLDRAFAGADIVYLSGITVAVLEGDGRQTLFDALDRARRNGTRVAFDPNLRPRLWADDAEMCAVLTQAGAHADIVLPSFEDEETFYGDADPSATRDRWLRGGAKTVIVKNGGGEITYHHAGEGGQFSPAPVAQVVDSTAAGDSFNAGFLACDGAAVADAVANGYRIASQVIQGRGALVEISV